MSTLRERILAARRPTRLVHVEEWGEEIGIRELSLRERQQLLQHWLDAERGAAAFEEDQKLPEDERKGVPKVNRLDETQLQLMAAIVDPATHEVVFPIDKYDEFQELGYLRTNKLVATFLEMNTTRTAEHAYDLKKTSDQTSSDVSSSD